MPSSASSLAPACHAVRRVRALLDPKRYVLVVGHEARSTPYLLPLAHALARRKPSVAARLRRLYVREEGAFLRCAFETNDARVRAAGEAWKHLLRARTPFTAQDGGELFQSASKAVRGRVDEMCVALLGALLLVDAPSTPPAWRARAEEDLSRRLSAMSLAQLVTTLRVLLSRHILRCAQAFAPAAHALLARLHLMPRNVTYVFMVAASDFCVWHGQSFKDEMHTSQVALILRLLETSPDFVRADRCTATRGEEGSKSLRIVLCQQLKGNIATVRAVLRDDAPNFRERKLRWAFGLARAATRERSFAIALANTLFDMAESKLAMLTLVHLIASMPHSLPSECMAERMREVVLDGDDEAFKAELCALLPPRHVRQVWGDWMARLEPELFRVATRQRGSGARAWQALARDSQLLPAMEREGARAWPTAARARYARACDEARDVADLRELLVWNPVLDHDALERARARVLGALPADEVPSCCPITLDPVIVPCVIDGHAFERAAIFRWLHTTATHPMTRAAVEITDLPLRPERPSRAW